MDKQKELMKMTALGKDASSQLVAVGIDTPEKLREAGAESAFIRLRTRFPDACLMRLYGLECAVTDTPRGQLPPGRKQELKEFFNAL